MLIVYEIGQDLFLNFFNQGGFNRFPVRKIPYSIKFLLRGTMSYSTFNFNIPDFILLFLVRSWRHFYLVLCSLNFRTGGKLRGCLVHLLNFSDTKIQGVTKPVLAELKPKFKFSDSQPRSLNLHDVQGH